MKSRKRNIKSYNSVELSKYDTMISLWTSTKENPATSLVTKKNEKLKKEIKELYDSSICFSEAHWGPTH